MPAIIGVGRAKLYECARARVARIVPANVEERQKLFLKFFKKKLLTSKIRAAKIHFMVEQQAT